MKNYLRVLHINLCSNHFISKQLDLNDLKSRLPNLQTLFRDLKSEVKDVITDDDRLAFRVEQNALFFKHNPEGIHVKLDVIIYINLKVVKLKSGKFG